MLYRKSNLIVLINNVVIFGFLVIKKNVIYSQVDLKKNALWVYKKIN